MAVQNSQSRKDQALVISEQRISQSPSVSLYVVYHTLPTLFSRRIPCFGLSALCGSCPLIPSACSAYRFKVLASSLFPPSLHAQTFTPPFVLRMGFGAIFAGAGYVLASGDSRNGSGIATGNCASKHLTSALRTLTLNCSLVTKLRCPRAVFSWASTISPSSTQRACSYSFRCYGCDGYVVWNGAFCSRR